MSVPKRFKTKVQLTNTRRHVKVLTKGNCFDKLSKDMFFIHTTLTKRILSHKVDYYIKKLA